MGKMKWVGFIFCVLISFSAFCNPRDSVSREERKKAKIERQRHRIMKPWDERSVQQKKTDRRILLFMAISAGILVNNIAHKE